MYRIVMITILAALLSAPAIAQQSANSGYEQRKGPPGGQRRDHVQSMVSELGLSEEQSLEVQAIFGEAEDQRRALSDVGREEHCALRQAVDGQLAEVLTQEQYAQMESLRDEHRSRHSRSSGEQNGDREQGKGNHGHRGPGPGDCN